MSITQRVDELLEQGVEIGRAIAQAITEKQASVEATERYAHGGARLWEEHESGP